MENRNDFEPTLLLTEQEWKKRGYKLITGAKFDKFVKGEDEEKRYDCNAVCRLKPAKTIERTTKQWLEKGYVPKDGAFGREMHYYSQDGIFIYTEDEVEQNEEKVKAILEEKRKARNERQRQNRIDRKERRRELEELLDSRIDELNQLRSSFESKNETLEKLTKESRSKKYNIVEVAFDRYRTYDFVTYKSLDEYLEGEKISIPGYDEAIIVGTRKDVLKYTVFYPSFYFEHYYKTVDGASIDPETYVVDAETEAFEKQRREDYKRYVFLKDWCEEAEEKLWYGHY